jgi:carbamoyl-phosphate synthase large subunit
VLEGPPHVVDALAEHRIQLVINTTQGTQAVRDSYAIRRNALLAGVPYFTTMPAALAAVDALEASDLMKGSPPQVRSLQEWHAISKAPAGTASISVPPSNGNS